MFYIQPPPAIYDHPFHGKTSIQVHNEAWLRDYCGDYVLGCTPIGGMGGVCVIFTLPPNTPGLDYEKLIRHETAHCNGWPANHPT